MKHYNLKSSTGGDSYISQGLATESEINNSTKAVKYNNHRHINWKFESTYGDTLNSNREDLTLRTDHITNTYEPQRKTQSNSVSVNAKTKSVKNFEQCGEIDLINSKTKTESLSVRKVHKVKKISRAIKYTTTNEASSSSRSTMNNLNTKRSNLTRESLANPTDDLTAVNPAALKTGNRGIIKETISTFCKNSTEQHSHFVLKNSETYLDHTHLDYGRVDLVDSNVINWRSSGVKKFYGFQGDRTRQNKPINRVEHKSDSQENPISTRLCTGLEISNRNDFFIENISHFVQNEPNKEFQLETYSINLINEEEISSPAIINRNKQFELETYSINLLMIDKREEENLEAGHECNGNKEHILKRINYEEKFVESNKEELSVHDSKNTRVDCSQNNHGNVNMEKIKLQINDDTVITDKNISAEEMNGFDMKIENKSSIIKEASNFNSSSDQIKIKFEQETFKKLENESDEDNKKEIATHNVSMKSVPKLQEPVTKIPNVNSEMFKLSIELDEVIVINHDVHEEEQKVLAIFSDNKEDKNSNIENEIEPHDNYTNQNEGISDPNVWINQKITLDLKIEPNKDNLVVKSKMANNCILRKEKNKKNDLPKNTDCVKEHINAQDIIINENNKIVPSEINSSFKIASNGEIIYSVDINPELDLQEYAGEDEQEEDLTYSQQTCDKEDQKLVIETSSNNSLIARVEDDSTVLTKHYVENTFDINTDLNKISKEILESTGSIELISGKITPIKLESINHSKENLVIESLSKIKLEQSKKQLAIIEEEQLSPVLSNIISNNTSCKASNNMLMVEDVYSYTFYNISEKNINQKLHKEQAQTGAKSPYEIQVNLNQKWKNKVYEKRRPDANYSPMEILNGGVKNIKNYEFVEVLSDKDIISVANSLNNHVDERRREINSKEEEHKEANENFNDLIEIKSSKAEETQLNFNSHLKRDSKRSLENLLFDKNEFEFSLVNISGGNSNINNNADIDEKIGKNNIVQSNFINLPANYDSEISLYNLLLDKKFNNRQKNVEEEKSDGKFADCVINKNKCIDPLNISQNDECNTIHNTVADLPVDELINYKNIKIDTEKFIPVKNKNPIISQFLTNISHKKQNEDAKSPIEKIKKDSHQLDDKIYECNFIQPQDPTKLQELKHEINSNNNYKKSTELSDKSNENRYKTSFIQIYQKSKLNLKNSKGKKYYPEKQENWQLNINTSRVNESNQNTSINNKKEKSFVNDKIQKEDAHVNKSNFTHEDDKKIETHNTSNFTNQKLKTTKIKKFISIKDKSINTSDGYKSSRYDVYKDTATTNKTKLRKNEVSQFVSSYNWQQDEDDSSERLEKENLSTKFQVVPKLEFNDRSQIDIIMMKYGLSNELHQGKPNKIGYANNNDNDSNDNKNNISSSLYKSPKQKTVYNFDSNVFNLKISPKLKQIPKNDLNKSTNTQIELKLNESSFFNPQSVNQNNQLSFTHLLNYKHHTRTDSYDYTNINKVNYTATNADKSAQKPHLGKDQSNCINNSNASYLQNSNLNYRHMPTDKLDKNILDKTQLNSCYVYDYIKADPLKTIKQTYEEYITHLNKIANNHNINSLKINLDNYRFEYEHNLKKINNLINDYKTTLSECECDINCRICFEFYLKHNHYLYSNQKRGKLFYNLKENKELIKVQSVSFFSDKNSRDSMLNSSSVKKSFDNSNVNSKNNFYLNTKRINFPVIYPSNKL